eukprot:ANDGO_00592.mRNA.1 hypothetical protein
MNRDFRFQNATSGSETSRTVLPHSNQPPLDPRGYHLPFHFSPHLYAHHSMNLRHAFASADQPFPFRHSVQPHASQTSPCLHPQPPVLSLQHEHDNYPNSQRHLLSQSQSHSQQLLRRHQPTNRGSWHHPSSHPFHLAQQGTATTSSLPFSMAARMAPGEPVSSSSTTFRASMQQSPHFAVHGSLPWRNVVSSPAGRIPGSAEAPLVSETEGSAAGMAVVQVMSCRRCKELHKRCDRSGPPCLRCFQTGHECEYSGRPQGRPTRTPWMNNTTEFMVIQNSALHAVPAVDGSDNDAAVTPDSNESHRPPMIVLAGAVELSAAAALPSLLSGSHDGASSTVSSSDSAVVQRKKLNAYSTSPDTCDRDEHRVNRDNKTGNSTNCSTFKRFRRDQDSTEPRKNSKKNDNDGDGDGDGIDRVAVACSRVIKHYGEHIRDYADDNVNSEGPTAKRDEIIPSGKFSTTSSSADKRSGEQTGDVTAGICGIVRKRCDKDGMIVQEQRTLSSENLPRVATLHGPQCLVLDDHSNYALQAQFPHATNEHPGHQQAPQPTLTHAPYSVVQTRQDMYLHPHPNKQLCSEPGFPLSLPSFPFSGKRGAGGVLVSSNETAGTSLGKETSPSATIRAGMMASASALMALSTHAEDSPFATVIGLASSDSQQNFASVSSEALLSENMIGDCGTLNPPRSPRSIAVRLGRAAERMQNLADMLVGLGSRDLQIVVNTVEQLLDSAEIALSTAVSHAKSRPSAA